MYHRIESPGCPVTAPEERPWAVALADFARQLDRLREWGRVGVSMDDVHRRLAAGGVVPAEWVALTFDDGNRSDHEHALPLLAERGFRATFFVCGERVDRPGGLAAAMIREMHAAGMHIGSHAMTHRFLTRLAAQEEVDEVRRSRALLESIVADRVDHFAPPGGRWSRRTAHSLAQAGYAAVSTSAYGFNDDASVRFAYRRLPVVRSTPPGQFRAMVCAERGRLWPGYLRAGSLGLARRVLGEGAYGRARAVRGGNHP
jgi:peptidoglycan/xylan/chitin deacetylase (PgdA/CDA1 family)